MKPGDFLLGVLDFFAILLPGALATWLVTRYIPPDALVRALSFGGDADPAALDGVRAYGAFLISSYILGHFVFMASSKIDGPYDRWRNREKPTERDTAFKAAEDLRKTLTPTLVGGELSTLKWAKAYVGVALPSARVEIDRLEADSKFFRGMVVISIALALHFLLRERLPFVGAGVLAVTVLSYHRYRDQRWKMTELSYGTAVIIHAVKARSATSATPDAGSTTEGEE